MRNNKLSNDVEIFCTRHGISKPFQIEPILVGRNSQVLKIVNADKKWILKKYYQSKVTKHDRLGTDFNFLVFLHRAGVDCVPKPYGMDRAMHLALYSFLPGNRLYRITATHIKQASRFILAIDQQRLLSNALDIPLAVDACLSWQDHIALTDARISLLVSLKPESAIEENALEFITKQLMPLWSSVRNRTLNEIPTSELARPLLLSERIISPSDFGFHNTIEHEGRLSFVDFEYAGWDDPAKLICDFLCQPELPITKQQGWQFTDELLCKLPYAETVKKRVDKLLPAHRIKWSCILLNEFRLEDRRRRLHAGVKSHGLLASQLSKSISYFNLHLSSIT